MKDEKALLSELKEEIAQSLPYMKLWYSRFQQISKIDYIANGYIPKDLKKQIVSVEQISSEKQTFSKALEKLKVTAPNAFEYVSTVYYDLDQLIQDLDSTTIPKRMGRSHTLFFNQACEIYAFFSKLNSLEKVQVEIFRSFFKARGPFYVWLQENFEPTPNIFNVDLGGTPKKWIENLKAKCKERIEHEIMCYNALTSKHQLNENDLILFSRIQKIRKKIESKKFMNYISSKLFLKLPSLKFAKNSDLVLKSYKGTYLDCFLEDHHRLNEEENNIHRVKSKRAKLR